MRNNSKCDRLCNNKACGYDGGECPIPGAASSSTIIEDASELVTQSENRLSKKQPISILRTAESPVLIAINQYSANLISQHDRHSGDFSSSTYQQTSSSSSPSSVFCSGSSVNAPTSFIIAGNEAKTVQSDSCSGLATCSSCGVCGLCRPQGCDTSFFDNFCQGFGPSWKCAAVIPSTSNNFSATACIDTAPSKPVPAGSAGSNANQNTNSHSISPGAIAGITVGILIVVACAAAVAIYAFKRRVQANSAIDGIGLVEVQVSLELPQETMPASANGTSSQARVGDDTAVTISAASAQQDATVPPPASTAGSDLQPG
jgi:hypothetical protein